MARDYANIFTAIWGEDDFRALTASQQRTYFLLVTQPDISAAGTLDLTVKRWSRLAADTTRTSVREDLEGLEAARFVFIDEDEEELLVRTFVKHDKGYGNSKRRGAIIDAAKAVQSPRLRKILWSEFEKLNLLHLLPPLRVSAGDRASDALSQSSDENTDRASAKERVVVTKVGKYHNPQTAKPHTAAGGSTRARASAEPPPAADDPPGPAERVVTGWIAALPSPVQDVIADQVGVIVQAALGRGIREDYISEALRRWQAKGNVGVGALPGFIHEVSQEAPALGHGLPDARAAPGNVIALRGPAAARGHSPNEAAVAGWLGIEDPRQEALQ